MQGLVRILVALIVLIASAHAADEIEFLNGSTLKDTVIAIHKADREVEFEAMIGGKKQVSRYPYSKIHRVVWKGKEYVVTKKAPTFGGLGNSNKPFKLTLGELKKRIAEVGSVPPDWLADTPLEYPETLDLSWPKPAPKGWNNRKNVGQYLWDRINPNEGKWRSGVKLMTHLLETSKDGSELNTRVKTTLASMYFKFFQDYARAAYWWEQAGDHLERDAAVGLAECYFRLGSVPSARSQLKDFPISLAKSKLLGDMGEFSEALGFVRKVRLAQPRELYLIAGDICRLDGTFKDAITWYEKVLSAPKARNEDYEKRYHARANDSINTIKRFELLDISKLADGVYEGSAMGYEGPIEVAATVKSGRVDQVEITKHKEKQ